MQTLHYGWYDEEAGWLLLSSDDDRFTNHSPNPNSRWDGKGTVAARDIRPGEEITLDYRELGGTDHTGWSRWKK